MSAEPAPSAAADKAGEVRPGEALDIEALRPWLDEHVPGLSGTPRVTQFSGGVSNWTYRLEFDDDDLILRRPPAGTKAKSANDMAREFRIQSAIAPVFPYVPTMRGYCADAGVIGAEFYVMDRIAGIIPRRNLPRGVTLSPEDTRRLCHHVLDTLIALHTVDAAIPELASIGAGAGYTERQIAGWTRRYRDSRTWNAPRGARITRWLEANLPKTERLCVTHNDYRFDNLVLDVDDPTRILGVLDWELATIGDPLMDLGNMLAYWVEAGDDRLARATRRQPTTLPGMLTRREVVEYYVSRTGFEPENWTFYEVYGLFRLSAIAQQIYYRYHHRETRNPAFRHFWVFVHYLHRRCRRAIDRSERS